MNIDKKLRNAMKKRSSVHIRANFGTQPPYADSVQIEQLYTNKGRLYALGVKGDSSKIEKIIPIKWICSYEFS